MYEEREIISLLLGLGVLAFMMRQHRTLAIVPNSVVLQSSFVLLFVSLTCSVVEAWFWNTFFNDLQHITSALSAVALAMWCWLVSREREALG